MVKAIEILANRVHPLALGNVERFLSQSRLIARKILRTHMTDEMDEHTIDEIVENLASRLYFHGHPINRVEAREELRLKINADPPPELEAAMWDLYKLYEKELQNQHRFRPADDLMLIAWPENANQQQLAQAKAPCQIQYDLVYAFVESSDLVSRFRTRKRYMFLGMNPNQEPVIREDTVTEGWDHSLVRPSANRNPKSRK